MSGVEPDDVNRQPLRRIARSEAGKAGAGEDLTDAIGELWTKCEPKDRCFEAALAEIVDCGSKLASTIPSDRQSGDPKVFGAFLLLAERLQDADQSVEAVKESMVAFCRKCFADGPHGTHWKDAVLEALELMIDHKRGDVIKVEAFAPEERSPYLR
ncbi:MAG: hypothetical protein KDD70_12660, partial [Bdellovibrionales bacterium]|nr:hypothetical protein [Bdellovibrionales bacterium]